MRTSILLLGVTLAPTAVLASSSFFGRKIGARKLHAPFLVLRGGEEGEATASSETSTSTAVVEEELTLDEKVYAAMRKLGLQPPAEADADADVDAGVTTTEDTAPLTILEETFPADADDGENVNENCADGVCEIPSETKASTTETETVATAPKTPTMPQEDPYKLANRIADTMKVDRSMAWAALGATSTVDTDETNTDRVFNEKAAREMIQLELEMIAQIQEDSTDVQLLVEEGYDTFLVRRALAFAERNIEDARAILMADKMDEEEEAAEAAAAQEEHRAAVAAEKKNSEATFKTVNVKAGFDPAKMGGPPAAAPAPQQAPPKPAAREAVIFEATGAQIQELVLESPVPVLLDIYADWCGPCKALSPILEEMAIKGGGAFRLVKVNSDNERAISGALEVTSLPTIFAIRDGKILHKFEGMPKSQDMMQNFMMGLLIPGQSFSPALTAAEKEKYVELSTKLVKVAGSAGFSFSARERLQDRVMNLLDDLVEQTGDVFDAEQSATTLRSLFSNIVGDPYAAKFRTVNLANKVIAAKVGQYPACKAILKGVGFVKDSGGQNTMTLGKNKKIVSVAPLTVAGDAIDKWIDKTRYEVAKAARKRRDEVDRVRVQAELAAAAEAEKANTVEEVEVVVDPNECKLKVRLDGKKKVHKVILHADDPLSIVLEKIPGVSTEEGEVQITCVAKRLVVKSTDSEAMSKSLREHGLMPNAAIVVKTAAGSSTASTSTLSERAAAKKKKTGSHSMHSIGLYAKDDNAKGELIDGGGGTWYEQDVSDDEGEQQVDGTKEEEQKEDEGEKQEAADKEDGDEAEAESPSDESIEEDE